MTANLQSRILPLAALLLLPTAAASVAVLGDAGHTLIQLDIPDHAPPESSFTVTLTAQGTGILNATLLDVQGCTAGAPTRQATTNHVSAAWTILSRHDPCRLLFSIQAGNETTYVPAVVTLGSWDEEVSYWLPYVVMLGIMVWGMATRNFGLILLGFIGMVGNSLPLWPNLPQWPFSRLAVLFYAAIFFVSWYLIQGARLRRDERERRAKVRSGERD